MSTIRILPEKVASQIAAGEVIERPSCVVRELIDNSMDAGATRVLVRIEKGGKRLIKVTDNGAGMTRDDLLLCLERHATSKIESVSDLLSVRSFGFRGEALPSMAAVGKLQIISRPRDQLIGHRIKVAGGKFIDIEETGAPSGTAVEVKDLFYNIPARKKFLRSARTEAHHMIDVLSRAALPFVGTSFRLEEGGKLVLNLPETGQYLQRLSGLIGRKVAQSMETSRLEKEGLTINTYLAPPEYARTRGDRLFVYVNQRSIRDRLVTRAVMEGYGQRLMKGRYPQAVVFVEIDPSRVDVNVHPTKQQVRFQNGNEVFEAIALTVEKGLKKPFGVSAYQSPRDPFRFADQVRTPSFVSEPAQSNLYRQAEPDLPETAVMSEIGPTGEGPQIIGQLGNTYILCQVEDGFLMVDQHAAHERIVYEGLKKGFHGSKMASQVLLIPHELELTSKETGILLAKMEQFSRLGMEVDHFGGNTFLLRSVPAILGHAPWDALFSELLAAMEEGTLDEELVLDRMFTIMACHGAIRAGHRMSREEMSRLLDQLKTTDLPTNCPHGRPTSRHFTFYDIEKMFKRVV